MLFLISNDKPAIRASKSYILPVHIRIFSDSMNNISRVLELLKRHSAKYWLGEGIQSPLFLIAKNFHEEDKFFCPLCFC